MKGYVYILASKRNGTFYTGVIGERTIKKWPRR